MRDDRHGRPGRARDARMGSALFEKGGDSLTGDAELLANALHTHSFGVERLGLRLPELATGRKQCLKVVADELNDEGPSLLRHDLAIAEAAKTLLSYEARPPQHADGALDVVL